MRWRIRSRRSSWAVAVIVVAAFTGLLANGLSAATGPTDVLAKLAHTVHSLRMEIRTPPAVARVCAEIKRDIKAPVRCPRLIPAARIISWTGTSGPLDPPSRALYTMTFNNGGEDPESPLSLHWIVGAGSLKEIQRTILEGTRNEVKGRAQYLGSRELFGHRATLYKLPPYPAGGPYGGHTLALVSIGGARAVFASVHGYQHLDASLAMAIAMASD